jgi:hypothetical protein
MVREIEPKNNIKQTIWKAEEVRLMAKKKAAKKVRCAAKTKDGKRCKRFVTGKGKYCAVHKKR